MCFLLKIYFAGLIAFVGPEGGQMQVIMVDARQPVRLGNINIPAHDPLLLAMSDTCKGNCLKNEEEKGDGWEKLRQLMRTAQKEGGLWPINKSSLSIEIEGVEGKKDIILYEFLDTLHRKPACEHDEQDFRWVADLAQIKPEASTADLMSGRIVAQMTLDTGTLKTYSLVSVEQQPVELTFSTSDGSVAGVPPRVYANVAVAEIEVPMLPENQVPQVSIQDTGMNRTLNIGTKACGQGQVVEVALLNLPKGTFDSKNESEEMLSGDHFGIYYDISTVEIPPDKRPIPQFADPRLDGIESLLLGTIGMEPESILDRSICPLVSFRTSQK